jgi:phage gp16-like protein
MKADERLRLIKLIHVARRELGMDRDTYGVMLAGNKGLEGATSTADLSIPKLRLVLELLKSKGFKVRPNKKPTRPPADDPQAQKIRALWLTLHGMGAVRDPSESALAKFVFKMTHVKALQWLTVVQARQVIENLKQWEARISEQAAPPQESV